MNAFDGAQAAGDQYPHPANFSSRDSVIGLPVADLPAMPRWVAWQTQDRAKKDGTKEQTKVPHSPKGYLAKADNPATWGTRDAAEKRAAALPKPYGTGGIGINLGDVGNGLSMGGIDLDTCRADDGSFSPFAMKVMQRFASYTEVSPSKTGAKVFFTFQTADLPALREAMGTQHSKLWQRNAGHDGTHPPAIELHLGNRYFAWTDDHLPETPAELRPVDRETLLWLIRDAGPAFKANNAARGVEKPADDGAEPDDLSALIEAKAARWPTLARRWAGDWTGLKDQSRSGKAMSLCAVLKLAGFNRQEVVAALGLHPDTQSWIAEATVRDIDRIFEKAGTKPKQQEQRQQTAADDLADDDGLITEGSVSEAFTRAHRDIFRFDHDAGSWFMWTGSSWQKERTKRAYRWAHQLARELASATGNNKAIVSAGKAAFAAGVERIAQSDPVLAVTNEVWDADPWLLGTPAGTVDLRTGELHPARQADHITKQTAVSPAPTATCPQWRAFLKQATNGDDDLVGFLQRWFGYTLTGITREHALLFVFGDGGNGKGVCMNTIAGVMGDYCTNAAMDSFTATTGDKHPCDMAMLAGARMVMTTEVDEGQVWAEARLKSLTGGDPITARFMRRDFFTFTPAFKLTVSGNHKPGLKNVDAAARRRFNLAPFVHRPAVPDKMLPEKLKAEWPGILRWMIEGCLEWQRDGLKQPAVVKLATEEYFENQDVTGKWLNERCIIHPTLQIKPSLLLADCRQWTAENGEAPLTAPQFRGALERVRGVRYAKVDGLQWVKGIGLKPPAQTQRGDERVGEWR